MDGRRATLQHITRMLPAGKPVIWMHTASLGEYEQGLPVLQELKKQYPGHCLLVTFFSPSGYEAKKDRHEADLVTYLPLDLPEKVDPFLDLVSPVLAIFVKYEVWPNYFRALKARRIPILLISARFRKSHIYFRWYGGFMKKALTLASHIFVQDEDSMRLLQSAGVSQCSISGDTRFDRVMEITKRDNSLPFMEEFAKGHLCLVAGSTWPEDENLIVAYLNKAGSRLRCVLAPHDIEAAHIEKLRHSLSRKVIRYSEIQGPISSDTEVLILDTIGLLTRVYSYADIAYVGGGFATGLHNTLEPAAFGIPVIIGPGYEGFREARELVARGGLVVVGDGPALDRRLDQLIEDPTLREQLGRGNAQYVREQQGASIQIMDHIRTLL